MWIIESITINKYGNSTGEANVKLSDENGNSLFLNKFIIDLHDGRGAIGIVKYQNTPVFSGPVVDNLKEMLHEIFQQSLKDYEIGLYKISEDNVEKL